VEFLPPFHSSLVWDALCILKPLDPALPLACAKKVLFVFILEVLQGARPKDALDLHRAASPVSVIKPPQKQSECCI
jgi:hypothetical protein